MSSHHFKQTILIFIITVFSGYQVTFGQIFGSDHELKHTESFLEDINNTELLQFLLQKDIRGGHITIVPSTDDKITVEVEYIVVSSDKNKGQVHLEAIKTSVLRDNKDLTFTSIAPRNNSLFNRNGGFPTYIKNEQVNYTVKMPSVSSIQKLKAITDNGNIKINEIQINQFELHNDDGSVLLTSCKGEDVFINTDNGNISTDQCLFQSIKANVDDGNMFISGISKQVELNVDNGNINLKDCQGIFKINADDGSIHLHSVHGELFASVDNGKVESESSTFSGVKISTDDGKIHVGNVNGVIHLNTDNGNIHLSNSMGEIIYSTDDGNLTLENCSGTVRGQTDNGSINIQNGVWDEINVQVDDGNIKINSSEVANTEVKIQADNTNVEISLPQSKELQIVTQDGSVNVNTPVIQQEANIRTKNGQIHLTVDPKAPYAIQAKTRNGKINNNLPLQSVKNEPKNELSGKIGNGSIPIKVETQNGSIHLN